MTAPFHLARVCYRCDVEFGPTERGPIVREDRWICDECTADNRALTREEAPANRRAAGTMAVDITRSIRYR